MHSIRRSLVSVVLVLLVTLIGFSVSGCLGGGGGDASSSIGDGGSGDGTDGSGGSIPVSACVPASGATGVSTGTGIIVVLSDELDSDTVTASTFLVRNSGGALIAGLIGYTPGSGGDSPSILFVPTVSLLAGTRYTVTLTTGIHSASGGTFSTAFSWSFMTTGTSGGSGGSIPVLTYVPINGATGISTMPDIYIVLSAGLDQTSITTGTFTVTHPTGAVVAGAITYNPGTDGIIQIPPDMLFRPLVSLQPGTTYTVTLTTGLRNAAGISFSTPYSWSFTTAGTAPVPTVGGLTANNFIPGANSTGMSLTPDFRFSLNQHIDPSSVVSGTTVILSDLSGNLYPIRMSESIIFGTTMGSIGVWSTGTLQPNTAYQVRLTTGIRSIIGDTMSTDYIYPFSTGP